MSFELNIIHCGDALEWLKTLPDNSVHCCVTSPPYWGLRDYGVEGQLGLENIPDCHAVAARPIIGYETRPCFDEDGDGNWVIVGERPEPIYGHAAWCGKCYVCKMVAVFCEVRRVLRKDGTLWLNMGDSYAQDTKWGGTTGGKHAKALHGTTGIGRNRHKTGLPGKNLIGVPWRVAFALQADGWWLRSDIIWHKPNPMPESVRDRPTKAHEYVFLMSKAARYYYDAEAIKEDSQANEESCKRAEYGRYDAATGNAKRDSRTGKPDYLQAKGNDYGGGTRNKRTVWTVATQPFKEAHYATFPQKLIEPCILAGCPEGSIVLDPFMGSGTTAMVAQGLDRDFLGCELNPQNVEMARRRIFGPLYAEAALRGTASDHETHE